MISQPEKSSPILAAIAVITGLVFVADSVTSFGLVFWVLYLIALVLTVRQTQPALPLFVAGVQIGLTAISFSLKPDSDVQLIALLNRAGGAAALLCVAYMARRVILERIAAQRLLWTEAGLSKVSDSLIGEHDIASTADAVLTSLASYLHAQVAVLYRYERGQLIPAGAYGCELPTEALAVAQGGLAKEVATSGEAVTLSDLPDSYLKIRSMTGHATPRHVIIAPITASTRVVGVVELGFLAKGDLFEQTRDLLQRTAESVGVALRSASYREHLKQLLDQTQQQSEEMQVQQEELRVSNEELEEQGRALRESQARLENQHAELEQTNVQLEEHTQRLARQKEDLLRAQHAMTLHSRELSRANQYKSEFLANMSHELRTPLNSSLILSQILCSEKGDNLSAEQRRTYARTIHDANNDLLLLINDILDLSKIEAGHVELQVEPVTIAAVLEPLRQMFEPIAAQRKVDFLIDVRPGAPAVIDTDRARLAQIMKNLLSNAFKFTSSGSVSLSVDAGSPGNVVFSVRDSGIGISSEQQAVIFEAFRQADGTTSRKYGGTGLGLSISRELTRLLGGEISVSSQPGQGSIFTIEIAAVLAVPQSEGGQDAGSSRGDSGTQDALTPTVQDQQPSDVPRGRRAYGAAADDTEAIERGRADGQASIPQVWSMPAQSYRTTGTAASESARYLSPEALEAARLDLARARDDRRRLILLIEDDNRFVQVLSEMARDLNFECAVAENGVQALAMARELRPSGILLDVNLPDQSGLGVLEQLKRDPATRHIPIHMLSVEDHMQTALELGAVGYALKPVAREELVQAFARVEEKFAKGTRRVLVIEDDEALRASIAELLQDDGVHIELAGTAAEAMKAFAAGQFDCVVMDLMLPDASGYELLERMAEGAKYAFPPVIVYTGRALTRDEEQQLRRYSRSIIIKGAKSPERLLDEVTLFLHRVEADMPPDQQRLLLQARQRDTLLERRVILLVEDDVRNIFALSSILEPLGAKLSIARNGREALDFLESNADVDLVLMDLMMPEMDGLTAMRHIRAQQKWAKLPIIALTAKAMPDDRKQCLEAGANDYIAKPIDVDKLVSLCRVWMPK